MIYFGAFVVRLVYRQLNMKITLSILAALFAVSVSAQTPIQATSQSFTNQFPSGPVTNAVVDGTTNKVPMQPWTVQEIEVVTILRAQRTEMRVTLPTMPLLSLKTNVPSLIGPPEPKKNPSRKPRS